MATLKHRSLLKDRRPTWLLEVNMAVMQHFDGWDDVSIRDFETVKDIIEEVVLDQRARGNVHSSINCSLVTEEGPVLHVLRNGLPVETFYLHELDKRK